MQRIRQVIGALLGGIALFGLAIGAILTTMAEGYSIQLPTPVIPTPTLIPTDIVVFLPSPDPAQVSTSTPFATPTPTNLALLPTSTSCSHPTGWGPVSVQAGDTLDSLANRYKTTSTAIKNGNCLVADVLPVGSIIYLPAPAATASCGLQPGWVTYVVRPGDTLYHLAWRYQTKVETLQLVNCMGNSYNIIAGRSIYVPRVAATLTVSPTVTVTNTPSPTNTVTTVATISATAPSSTPVSPTPSPTTPPAPTETPPTPASVTP